MKIGKNTSILSIATVLCVMTSVPLYAASSVRALGGAGTYEGASSAAGAKASGAANSVRAGSLRVDGTSGGTRASSTRGAPVSRLSIGKYLGGTTSVSGGSSLRPGQSTGGSVGGDSGKLQERVEALEQFVGYSETGSSIKIDVEALQADLNDITGKLTEVEFKDGFLKIMQNGKVVSDVELATAADLQAAVDAIVIPSLEGYAKLEDIEAKGFLTSADLVKTQEAIEALYAADVAMDAAIKSLQGGMLTADELNDKVAELTNVDTQLRSAIEELKTKVPTDGSFASVAYVDGLIAELRTADINLQSAISAIKQPDVDKAYVDTAVDALNGSIVALQSADSDLQNLINAVDAKFANVATKDELTKLQEKIDDITAGDIDLTNYYTKAEAEGMFVAKTDLNDLRDSIDVNSDLIATNTADIADIKTDLQSVSELATDASLVAATAQNAAESNAADIKELQEAGYITDAALAPYVKSADLAAVAITGSYDSLTNKPIIPTDVSELTGADDLVRQDDLLTLRTVLEAEISKKQQAGDYVTAAELRSVSDDLAALKADSYTKAEINNLIAYKVSASELGDLAYKNMSEILIGADQIEDGSITANKINTGAVPSGEMAMLLVGENGQREWVSITVDEEETTGQ